MGFKKLTDHINGGTLPQDPLSKLTDHINKNGGTSFSLGDGDADDFGQDITNDDFLPDNFSYASDYDAEELRAQNQPWISKAGAGVARIGVKVGAEVLKMPGVIGGIVGGIAGQIEDGVTGEDNTDFVQTAFNNTWIKAINDGNDYINNEALPVHVKKAVEEGNLWDNVTSMDFWATEGADGIGYIVSMLAPGAAINKLGLGSALTKSGSAIFRSAPKFSKAASNIEKSAEVLNKARVTANNIDLWTSTMANTLFEAGAEAQGAMDGFKSHLDSRLDSGEISTEEYNEAMKDQSKVGRDTFLFNTAVLIGPNAIMSKMIWGKARNKAITNIGSDGKKLSTIDTPKLLGKAKEVGKDLGKATAREGFFEEGLQSTGESFITEAYEQDKKYDDMSFSRAYADMLQTTDGQKAIFLGAALGGGMQSYTGAKSRKRERNAANEMIEAGNSTIEDVLKVFSEDIYQRDENGGIMYEGDNVTPKYNIEAVKDKLVGNDILEKLSAQYDIAIEQGNEEEVEAIKDAMVTNLILPFVVNENLGIDTLKQFLTASADFAKVAEREGKDPTQYINEIVNKAEYLKESANTFDNFASNVIELNNDNATEEDYAQFYSKINSQYLVNKSKKFSANRLLSKANKQLDDLLKEKKYSREHIEDKTSYHAMQQNDPRVKYVANKIKEATELIKDLDIQADAMWDSVSANSKFRAFVNNKAALEKEIAEGEEVVEDTLNEIKNAKTPEEIEAISKGKVKEEAKRKEEEAAVNKLVAGVEANPSIDNLRNTLNDLNNLQVSTYSINHILDSIEKRIKDVVAEQEAFSKFLDTLFVEVSASISNAKATIKDIDASIKELKRNQKKAIAALAKENKNPRGRNAKIIKQLIKETEKEIRLVDLKIAELEKEKAALEKEVKKLNDGLDSIVLRSGQVEISDFKSIEEVVAFIKENADKFKDHRFELQRLLVHRHYAEENVDALNDLIIDLEIYKEVLENTLKDKLEDLTSESHDLYYLQEQLNDTNEAISAAKKELDQTNANLTRLQKSITDKNALKSLFEELEFWESIQKTRKKNPISKVYDNPIVNEAVIAQQKKLKAAEAKRLEEEKLRDEQVKEAALATAEAEEAGVETAQQYYEFVLNNMNVGEGIPTPPPSFPIPQKIREQEGPYILHKKDGTKISIKRGNATVMVSDKSFKTTGIPVNVESSSSSTDSLANTEGGLVPTIIEEGDNLPKDKEGNVIDNNLQEVNNDARVITGTDSETGLSFISSTMVDFERTPRNKKGEEVTFEVNTQYDKGNQGKALAILAGAVKGKKSTGEHVIFGTQHLKTPLYRTSVPSELRPSFSTIKEKGKLSRIEGLADWRLETDVIDSTIKNLTEKDNISEEDANSLREVALKVDRFRKLNILISRPETRTDELVKEYLGLTKSISDVVSKVIKSTYGVSVSTTKNEGLSTSSSITGNARADLDFLIEHLPINAVFSETAKAPLETKNENPNLTKEQRDEYNKVFDKSSKLLRTAIIKEMVLNKTPISDISTSIAGQKNGTIMVDPTIDNLAAENSIKELREFGGELKNVKTDLVYVVNDRGVLVNHKGKQFPLNRSLAPGEVYIMIHTANGTIFPLKLNISKVKEAEADLLYEIYKFRFEAGYKKVGKDLRIDKTNDAIIAKVQEVFKDELGEGGLFTKNKKKLKDLSIGDIVNFLVWDGTASKKSQIRFYKDHLKVLGKTYNQEELANSREEFIQELVENKRRNITFKRAKDEDTNSLNFDNRSYVEYILNNNILNTNAVTGKDENGIYKPTFGKDTTIYLNTSNVRVANKLSDYNQAKKVTFINTLRGKKSDLAKALKGLFKKTLKLVGQDFYQEENNPKGTKYSRISNVTSEKDKKENLDLPLYYNAAKRGDVVDSLFRTFFSSGIESEAAFVAEANKELETVNKEKTKHGDISISDNAFRELYSILKDYEIEFNKRGYTIYSTTNPLYGVLSKGKRNVNTAGSMDLLAKDKTGRYIIIDIKTSSADRYENYQREDGGYYKEKDLRQQNGYAELFKQRTGITISEILILPISMQAKKDKGLTVNSVYTSATRSKSPTGFIEVDMSKDIFEIMGERKPTSTDFSDPTKKKKFAPNFKDLAEQESPQDGFMTQQAPNLAEEGGMLRVEPGEIMEQDTHIIDISTEEELSDEAEQRLLDSFYSQFPEAFDKKSTKKTPKKGVKKEATKRPKEDSGRPISFEKDGKTVKVILWGSGKVTDMDRKEITDAETIRLAKVAGGVIAGEGGKSEAEIRKEEKKAVSLSSIQKVMDKLDTDKLTDEEAKAMLLSLAKLKSLRSLRRIVRDIDNKEITPQEKVSEMLTVLENKGLVDAEVRKICKI